MEVALVEKETKEVALEVVEEKGEDKKVMVGGGFVSGRGGQGGA